MIILGFDEERGVVLGAMVNHVAICAEQYAFFNFFHNVFPFSVSDVAYNEVFFRRVRVMEL
jgi:hypothetical protein